MDRLGLGGAAPMHQTENSFEDGEKRVGKGRPGPLQLVEAEAHGDCFWQAFALAYTHDLRKFNCIKSRTAYWFHYVLRSEGHIRSDLYRRLDTSAGSGTIAQGDPPRLTLTQQLRYAAAWTSDEMFQVVADCFDVELLIFSPGQRDILYPVCVRGAHNRRQILLSMNEDGNHFDALIHNVDGVPRENYRYRHHRTSKDDTISDIPFHIFPNEKVDALRGMPLMESLPHPLPIRRLIPAAEKRRLVAAQLDPGTTANAGEPKGKGGKKEQQKRTSANPIPLDDGDNGGREQSKPPAANIGKSKGKGAKKEQQKGTQADPVPLDDDESIGEGTRVEKKRKRG